jgi:hypothetical protein
MKMPKILFSILVIIVLLGIDSQAADEDGLQHYGLILRGLIWFIIAVHGVMAYGGVRSIASEVAG